MSSRVVRSPFAIASRYARKRSASAGGPLRTGSLAASCASATDKSTQLRVASETSFLMGRLLPDKLWPDRGHSSDLTPLAVAVLALRTLPCLPLPGGEVEVVAPGGDLAVADLEHAGARQLDPLVAEAEAVDALGEDEVAARDEVDDLGLELLRG